MTRRLTLTNKVSGAYVRSIAREYPSGVSLITNPDPTMALRDDLLAIGIQNRDNQPIYFWYGRCYESIAAHNLDLPLPLNPATWTALQKTGAAAFIKKYGEAIPAGSRYDPDVAHLSPIYAMVDSAIAAVAHVKVATSTLPDLI